VLSFHKLSFYIFPLILDTKFRTRTISGIALVYGMDDRGFEFW